jgi:hypothetical protein
MKITDVHERTIRAAVGEVGLVLGTLATPDDQLWPTELWPPMIVEGPFAVGSKASHGMGAVKYRIAEYEPGRRVRFDLTPDPTGMFAGFEGCHSFEVEPTQQGSLIRHTIRAHAPLSTALKWWLVGFWLHCAIIEDGFDKVQRKFEGDLARPQKWNWWVKFLRRPLPKD